MAMMLLDYVYHKVLCYLRVDFYLYLCTVASPPSGVTAVQAGPTSIAVTWTASSDATGYRIHYTSDSDSGSETVSDGSIETHTLTGLVNGETYTISMIATSRHFFSEAVAADTIVNLGKLCLMLLALSVKRYC